MRTIKFRGKRIDNNEWVYGYLFPTFDEQIGIGHKSAYCSAVVPETTGQFTGLKDKNGKDIFEGDVDQYGCVCHFYNGSFVFGKIGNPTFIPLHDAENIEIVGTIHDNPELLK